MSAVCRGTNPTRAVILLALAALLLGLPAVSQAAQIENYDLTGLWNFQVSDSGDSSFDGPHMVVIEQFGAYYKARELNGFAFAISEDPTTDALIVINRYDTPTDAFIQFELHDISDGSGTGYAFKNITDGPKYRGMCSASRTNFSIQNYDSDYALLIPHLTGSDTFWTSYLTVANNTNDSQAAGYRLILYDDKGLEALNQTYSLAARMTAVHTLSTLAPSATWGRMEMLQRGLEAKLTFENQGGGLSQFALSLFTKPNMAFNFSNNFPGYVVWKGIALTNTKAEAVQVTLRAVKNGITVAQKTIILESRQRIVGTSETWFPDLDPTDFDAILATSYQGQLTGLAISGDYSGRNFISAASAFAPYY